MPLYSVPPPPFDPRLIIYFRNKMTFPDRLLNLKHHIIITWLIFTDGTALQEKTFENERTYVQGLLPVILEHVQSETVRSLVSYNPIWLPIVCVYLPLRSVCTCRPECTYTTWWSVYWYLVFIVYLVASMYLVWCTAGQCVHTT